MKNRRKLISIILFDLIVIIALITWFGVVRQHAPIRLSGVTYLSRPDAMPDFQLIDHHGKSFTQKNLQGHWTLLYFGFTQCPLICPTTMTALNGMYHLLEQELPRSQLPQVVFITVDPNHDSVTKLDQYVNSFNVNFIGARGRLNDIIALEKGLHLTLSDSALNHSPEIILINPAVKAVAYFSYPHEAHQLALDYKMLLNVAAH